MKKKLGEAKSPVPAAVAPPESPPAPEEEEAEEEGYDADADGLLAIDDLEGLSDDSDDEDGDDDEATDSEPIVLAPSSTLLPPAPASPAPVRPRAALCTLGLPPAQPAPGPAASAKPLHVLPAPKPTTKRPPLPPLQDVAELKGLKMMELRQRALDMGVGEDDVEAATDR